MEHLEGGMGDKQEDWVEHKHQEGARLLRRYRTVKNPLQQAITIERAKQRNKNSHVM